MLFILYHIIYVYNIYIYYILFFFSSVSSLERYEIDDRFRLFLYFRMNRMFGTIRTKFSQFQCTRRIMSILFSNISRNASWFIINTGSNTSRTFQNNRYPGSFTFSHEPPFEFPLFYISDPKRIRKKKL